MTASAADINPLPVNNTENQSGYTPAQTLQSSRGLIEGAVAVNQAAEDFQNGQVRINDVTPPVYEYDGLGRVVKTTYASGDFVITSYWGDTTNKYGEVYFGAGWVFQRSVVYWTDGITMHYQVFADPNPLTPGDDVKYEYDTQGRLIQKTLDMGDFVITRYWGSTANKYAEIYFKPDWIWEKSVQYRSDGVTVQGRWFADAHPGIDGDDNYYAYDLNGRIVTKRFDNGDLLFIDYWDSGNKKTEAFVTADWVWQNSTEYFDLSGGGVHYQWFADAHPATGGDTVYQERDSLGRVIFKRLDNDGVIVIDYWANGNHKTSVFFGAGWTWQKSIVYNETDGMNPSYICFADANPLTFGDVVYLEYDPAQRLIDKRLDNGDFALTSYWDDYTEPKYEEDYYGNGWVWQKSVQYWDDGVTMHYRWLADSNLLLDGDVVYEEYDAAGTLIFRRFDNGMTVHI